MVNADDVVLKNEITAYLWTWDVNSLLKVFIKSASFVGVTRRSSVVLVTEAFMLIDAFL